MCFWHFDLNEEEHIMLLSERIIFWSIAVSEVNASDPRCNSSMCQVLTNTRSTYPLEYLKKLSLWFESVISATLDLLIMVQLYVFIAFKIKLLIGDNDSCRLYFNLLWHEHHVLSFYISLFLLLSIQTQEV